jgi:lipid II:glycine glycyltransferase (peptidoglycan interpeptide bridge formation enzyme)
MIRDAREVGADIYDLRGITATLNQLDPTVGLINFKVGLGGRALQWMGEFDLVLNKPIAIAYALARRFK